MQAAVYARVSSEDQAREEKVSLETQTKEIETYCNAKGYEVVKPRYIDVQSGSDSLRNRPEFERMLDDANNGLFEVIVAWAPDRLFRSMWPAARLKKVIDEIGIAVETVKQPLDKKMLGLWAWLAEMEIDNFKERSKMGKRGVAHKGQVVNRCVPYGYQVDEQRYPQINEAEAYIIRRIFEEYVMGNRAVQSIADELNANKVPQRTQAKFGWSASYIHRMLKDRTYIGEGAYGKNSYGGNKRTGQPQQPQIVIPFPPIIDEGTFALAQEKKAHHMSRITHHHKVFYLLQDLAYCQECGHKFIPRTTWVHKAVRKSGKVYEYHYKPPLRYYKCFGMVRYPQHFNCRKPGNIKTNELDNLVWRKVRELLDNPALIVQGIESCQTQPDGFLEELKKANQQVSDLSWKRQKLINLHINDVISEHDLRIQLRFVTQRKEFFEAEVKRLSAEIERVQQQDMNLSNFERISSQLKHELNNITDEGKAEVVRLLVQKVWIDGDRNVTIEFAIPESIPALCNADMQARNS